MEPVCEAERELRLTVPSSSKIHFTAQVFSEEVRGSFLAHVLRGLTSSGALSISIEGYRIMGKVDLRGVSGISDLKLLNNTFDDDLDLSESSLGSLTIEHCSLYTLDATQIRVGHDLTIISSEIVGAKSLPLGLSVVVSPHDVGRMSTCAVSLRLAQVKGDFGIEGSQFGAKSTAEDGALPQPLYRAAYALAARQLSVSGAVNVSGSLFYGRVDLANATIDGEVAFAASTLSATSLTRSGGLIPDTALQLGGSRLGSSLWFVQGRDDEQQGVAVHGALRIPGVRIAGILQLTGLECFGTDISAFDARNARIDGSVYTNGTNTIFGPVRFEAANVGGEFDARNLTVVAHQESIQFSGITVGRALRFSEPFRCIGPVNLSGAKVGGDVA